MICIDGNYLRSNKARANCFAIGQVLSVGDGARFILVEKWLHRSSKMA